MLVEVIAQIEERAKLQTGEKESMTCHAWYGMEAAFGNVSIWRAMKEQQRA